MRITNATEAAASISMYMYKYIIHINDIDFISNWTVKKMNKMKIKSIDIFLVVAECKNTYVP